MAAEPGTVWRPDSLSVEGESRSAQREFRQYGEGAILWDWLYGRKPCPAEWIYEGQAGTGKTRGVAEFLNELCLTFPGTKWLVLREVRVDLNDAWMDVYENETLGPQHPVLAGDKSRDARRRYLYPPAECIDYVCWCPRCKEERKPWMVYLSPDVLDRQPDFRLLCQRCGEECEAEIQRESVRRSETVLGGMDKATRLYSTNYNGGYWNEVQEGQKGDWESLHRAMRRQGAPFRFLGGDCNPDKVNHWYCARCEPGVNGEPPRAELITGRFTDNPVIDREYVERLDQNTSGVRRIRLFLGQRCSAEGQVWATYDRTKHLIHADIKTDDQGSVDLIIPAWGEEEGLPKIVRLYTFVAGLDFGHNAPGCLHVYGYDADNRAFLVHEVYRRYWDIDQWAEAAYEARQRYPFRRLLCDHDPSNIKILNKRLGPVGGRDMSGIAQLWDKRRTDKSSEKAGIDVVRVLFKQDRMFILHSARQGRDPHLVQDSQPCGVAEEIPDWVYPVTDEGKEIKDEPDPGCADHGCDTMRGVQLFVFGRDMLPKPKRDEYAEGTYGEILNHKEKMRRARRRRLGR